MLIFGIIVAFIVGIIMGFAISFIGAKLRRKPKTIETQILLNTSKEENHKLSAENQTLRDKYMVAEKKISELSAKQNLNQELQKQFGDHFKNLSQEILENKSKQFQTQATENLSQLLNPLKDKLQDFQKQVKNTYDNESRERFSLKEKIQELCGVHEQLTKETTHLSKALKGDVKAQGHWGEVILDQILSASGLKENEHYTTQGQGLKLKDEEGKRQKPDVLIHLPDKKHIIIDAKVSLTHYERFITSSSEEEKQKNLSLFTDSLRSHVKQLNEKQYSQSQKLNTPEFVLMFFPIEGAFSLALQSDPEIFQFSWDHSIVIVSPTTLLATLKTVESIWKREKQNRNATEIASASGRLYDKFSSFAKDLLEIGSNLKRAENSYTSALQKLNTGKGNIVSKLEHIKQLGAKTSKQIPPEWIDKTQNQTDSTKSSKPIPQEIPPSTKASQTNTPSPEKYITGH